MYVLKQKLNTDGDGAHLTSFAMQSQKEEAIENEGSPSVALLCGNLLRRSYIRATLVNSFQKRDTSIAVDVFVRNLRIDIRRRSQKEHVRAIVVKCLHS